MTDNEGTSRICDCDPGWHTEWCQAQPLPPVRLADIQQTNTPGVGYIPPACTDPWHTDDDAPHDTYRLPSPGPGFIEGYRCRTCGFQTVTVEMYEPAEKVCPECEDTFEGMADVDGEYCDTCTSAHVLATTLRLPPP